MGTSFNGWRRKVGVVMLACILAAGTGVAFRLVSADESEESPKSNAAVREMYDHVAEWKITVRGASEPTLATLKREPILRYTDPQRECPDATLWVWMLDGRPAAFSKLERFRSISIEDTL